MVSTVWYKWQNSSWVYANKVLYNYVYDSNNNILREVLTYSGVPTSVIQSPGSDSIIYGGYSAYADMNHLNEEAISFKIFPNPCTGKFLVSSTSGLDKILITDLLGKVVFEQEGATKLKSREIFLEAPDKGIYFVSIISSGQSVIRRLVIE